MQSCGVRRPSVRLSVRKLCANRFFSQANGSIATKLAHDGPQKSPHPGCAQGQGRGQRSRDTGTSVMSRNVCYTVYTVSRSVSTCAHFMKHHYTLLPV